MTGERYLPVVGAGDDDSVEQVKLAVVDRGGRALGEVGVPEHRFHTLELLAVAVQQLAPHLA